MMNTEIKKRWVDALRSGKYKQGRKQLKNDKNEFCCLGVLCDILKDDVGGHWDKYNYFIVNDEARDGVLPVDVVNFSGLSTYNPSIKINVKTHEPLTYINDSGQYDFNQIANLIEKQL